ncbi:hypothetical protein [Actinoplanes teichomyceticus]|uniref:Uncharacterized protein n=1 Tax=Actinoplanes teichomyceticus TaxID=1867 RepID=A0A561VR06_ACTTI|nr:hypothetical protein [Actinoplanes teichomyceticus]TWG14028.1 hypothetical protein FHX34_104322 [Actinoplanes teichomyceticus]GIF16763.1 hypothetical protein Ate01nite_67950 [Actinoplanes teichomyceticus]
MTDDHQAGDTPASPADPGRSPAELIDDAVALAEAEDPLEAELAGALFVALARSAGDDAASFAGTLIPAVEARGTRTARTLLTAIGAVTGHEPNPVAASARAAAERLAGAGVAAPAWAGDLAQPLTTGPFTRMYDTGNAMSVLIGTFERAGRGHSLVVVVDHENGGAADEIYLVDEEELPTLVAGIHRTARRNGVGIRTRKLGAPEFRWYVEQALEARARHGVEDGVPGKLDPAGEDGPGYAALTVLTRSRLAALPPARRPRGRGHGDRIPRGGRGAPGSPAIE